MKDERKIGAVLGYVHIILHAVVGILYVPILLGKIGRSEYGLYQIVASVISYVAILETMFSATVLRHYNVYLAQRDILRMENLLFTARRLFRGVTVVIAVASIPVGMALRQFYSDSFTSGEMQEILIMYGVLILNLLISVNNYIYVACITAHQRFVFLKLISIISQVLQPIAVIVIIARYPYAFVIVLVQVVLNLAVSLLRFTYCRKKLHIQIRQHQELEDGLLRELLMFSLGIFMTAIADQIFWKTDQIILGKIYNTSAVAIYAVGAQLFNVYMSFSHGIGSVLLPTVIHKVNAEGITGADTFFRRIGRIQALLMGLVIAGFLSLGKEFIQLWVGDGYTEAYWVALLLMFPYLIDVIQGAGLSILQAVNKYSFRAKCMLVIAVMNVVLTLLLTRQMGIVGAAAATAISIVIGPGLIMNWYYQKKIGLDIKLFWREITPILLLACGTAGVGSIISRIYFVNTIISFVLHALLMIGVYAIGGYALVLNDFEKGQVGQLLSKIRKR